MLSTQPFEKGRVYVKAISFIIATAMLVPLTGRAQGTVDSSSAGGSAMTLDQCIDYALKHQPMVNQSLLQVSIARTSNAISLSGWLPQVNVSANATHYNTLPSTLVTSDSLGAINGTGTTGTNGTTNVSSPLAVHTGVVNTVIPQLAATQTIFNPQLLYAAHAAHLYVDAAKEVTDSTKIYIVTQLSKSFYNLLQTLEQINVLKEDTARLARNVMDTYHQYVGGIVDGTDYEEAIISLNNSKIQLKQQIENVTPQYATLKLYMGYPPEQQFNVAFDTMKMMQDIYIDTTQQINYDNRIEYQQIKTALQLQHEQTVYYNLAFLPTVSAFFNYYYEFENNTASEIFNKSYPYSYVGLSLNLPLFTGFSRVENIHRSRLQEQVVNFGKDYLKSRINTEYTTAMANYKSNLYNWTLLKDNQTRARNVYRIVSLQYKQGIVAYLNMIVAENNLITAEIGYTNALFQLLSSKVDLEKATGNISYNSSTR